MKFFIYTVLGYFIFVALLYLVQRHLIYFPSQNAPSPASAGVPELHVEKLHTEDALTLKAWYRPPQHPHMPTVVHFHGNAGGIGNRAIIVKPYLNQGFGVLLVTYRGYSGNPGKPSEEGLYRDGRAAIKFLQEQKVPEKCIVIYGDSIGAAVAVQMVLEYPLGGIILQAPFTSLADIGRYHYPFIPIRWFLKDKYETLKKASRIHVPVFIIHGQSDTIIPVEFGQKLFAALSEPKQIAIIPHTGHNDLFEPARIIQFIRSQIKCE